MAQPPNDNCSAAVKLCPGVVASSTTSGATVELGGADGDGLSGGTWGQCYNVNNSIWFSFKTNAAGGDVTVTIETQVCDSGSQLQAVLLQANTPCDPTSYVSLDCDTGLGNIITLTNAGLAPNTTYWVQVDGDDMPPPIGSCSLDINVSGPAVQWIIATDKKDVTCDDTDNGEATVVSVSGGYSPYTYQWNTGSTDSTITGLTAGTYTVTVTDSEGCDTIRQVIVAMEPAITGADITSTDTDCNANTGSASVNSVQGGTSPYTYQWSTGSTDPTITGLAAGTYTVTITDSNGCDTAQQVVVNLGSAFTDADVTTTMAGCNVNSGTITVNSVQGGTPPYSYSLDSTIFTPNNMFTALNAGTYQVVIRDSNNCDTVVQVVVEEPEKPEGTFSTLPADCNGENGMINIISVANGQSPYSYSLDGGAFQSTPSFFPVNAGTHEVIIVDANNCMDTSDVEVTEPPPLESAVQVTPAPCGQDLGSITVLEPQNGQGPYEYTISSGGSQSSPVFENLPIGSYTITVSDNGGGGCDINMAATITMECPEIIPWTAFSPNGDGFNDNWEVPGLIQHKNCRVIVYDRWGQSVYRSIGYDTPWDGKSAGFNVPDATYYWVIFIDKDDKGEGVLTGFVSIVR